MWNQKPAILVAEDDENDAIMLQRAFRRAGITNPVQVVHDGEQAILYLRGDGEYTDRTKYPFPGVIITDLKMPKVSGFEVLKWLKAHPECSVIPAVVLTASAIEEDVIRAYQLSCSCYLQKPGSFEKFERMIKLLLEFWQMCEIPKLSTSVCAEENPPDKK